MTEVVFSVRGAKLDSETVGDIVVSLSKVAGRHARALQREYEGDDSPSDTGSDDDTSRATWIRKQTESGEGFAWVSDLRAMVDGVSRRWTNDIKLEALDGSTNGSVSIELRPHWSDIDRVSLSGFWEEHHTEVHVTIEADEDLASAAERVITERLKATVDPEFLKEPEAPPFRVFLGHGGDRQWEVLRDYVIAAGYKVEAFESDSRASYATIEIVENMIASATVAIVVMTGADEMKDGSRVARPNVIHEIGFAQGKLGVAQTLILREKGTALFTNIDGLKRIEFDKGEIHTTSEEVLAALANRKRDHDAYGSGGGR